MEDNSLNEEDRIMRLKDYVVELCEMVPIPSCRTDIHHLSRGWHTRSFGINAEQMKQISAKESELLNDKEDSEGRDVALNDYINELFPLSPSEDILYNKRGWESRYLVLHRQKCIVTPNKEDISVIEYFYSNGSADPGNPQNINSEIDCLDYAGSVLEQISQRH